MQSKKNTLQKVGSAVVNNNMTKKGLNDDIESILSRGGGALEAVSVAGSWEMYKGWKVGPGAARLCYNVAAQNGYLKVCYSSAAPRIKSWLWTQCKWREKGESLCTCASKLPPYT